MPSASTTFNHANINLAWHGWCTNISLLRNVLFRHDQQVMPILASVLRFGRQAVNAEPLAVTGTGTTPRAGRLPMGKKKERDDFLSTAVWWVCHGNDGQAK